MVLPVTPKTPYSRTRETVDPLNPAHARFTCRPATPQGCQDGTTNTTSSDMLGIRRKIAPNTSTGSVSDAAPPSTTVTHTSDLSTIAELEDVTHSSPGSTCQACLTSSPLIVDGEQLESDSSTLIDGEGRNHDSGTWSMTTSVAARVQLPAVHDETEDSVSSHVELRSGLTNRRSGRRNHSHTASRSPSESRTRRVDKRAHSSLSRHNSDVSISHSTSIREEHSIMGSPTGQSASLVRPEPGSVPLPPSRRSTQSSTRTDSLPPTTSNHSHPQCLSDSSVLAAANVTLSCQMGPSTRMLADGLCGEDARRVGAVKDVPITPPYPNNSAPYYPPPHGPPPGWIPSPYTFYANYSSPTIYPNIAEAAGLAYGTPFQSPAVHAATLGAHAHQGPMPHSQVGNQHYPPNHSRSVPSRSSTGANPLAAALDGTQAGGQPSESADYYPAKGADVETFAPVAENAAKWRPGWEHFRLAVYRGMDCHVVMVQAGWDDERLLRELRCAYEGLCPWWSWFSMKKLGYVTMVKADHSFIYPQRVGPSKFTWHRAMRMRYLLAHPKHVAGQREFMRALTARVDYGVEFIEKLSAFRLCIPYIFGFVFALIVVSMWGGSTGDWAAAFGVGSFWSQNFALLGTLAAFVNIWEDF